LISDGTTIVSLSSTNCILNHYVPQTPKRNGSGELDLDDVTEAIEVTFTGASTAAATAAINSVERLLMTAAQRNNLGIGAKVYLYYQPIGEGVAWRSEVRAGELRLADNAMTVFGQAKISTRIILTRAPWWEGARTQIPLTNSNGTNNTQGLTIYNHDDSQTGHDNYADIAAGVVGGTLPAALEIQLQNTSGASRGYNHLYLANNRFATTIAHVLEGEGRVSGYGTVAPGSPDYNTYSNGQYVALSGTAVECHWNIPATVLQGTRGRHMRILARVVSATVTPTWLTPELRDYYGLVVVHAGREVSVKNAGTWLQDLGSVPLPPGGDNMNWAQQRLVLKVRAATATDIAIDFMQLLPGDPLCWRDVPQRGMQVANNDWIVDDGIESSTYLIEGGANHPIYAPVGQPLHVFPALAQRLYVLTDGTSYSVNWTQKIKAFYRPRRLTI
jgi:hypothetical protein